MRLPVALTFLLALSSPTLGEVVVFEETFGTVIEPDVCDAAFPGAWTLVDADGFTPAASVAWVDTAWVAAVDDFDPANCAAVSTSWYSDDDDNPESPDRADDWMITPLLHVPQGAILSWRAFSWLPSPDADGYEVRYSISGTSPDDFEELLFSVEEEETTWTTHRVDLAAAGLAGRAVYLAFLNDSKDDYLLYVDDVKVAFDDAIFREEFGSDGGTGFCSPDLPSDWIVLDEDLNPVSTTYPWMTAGWVAADTEPLDPSDCAAFSTSFYDNAPAQADDWLVTPPIALPSDAELRWEATAWDLVARDGYEVRYSFGGTAPTDFEANAALEIVPEEVASWTARAIDLDALGLGGQTVRFAFRNHSTDKDLLAIDSIEIAVPVVFRDDFDHGYLGAWSAAIGAAP